MTRAPSLVALVVRRIVFFAALAMMAQLAGVFYDYWSDDQNLGRHAIERETKSLARGVTTHDGRAAFALPPDLRGRYATASTGYFVRVRTLGGAPLFSNCDRDCEARLLPPDLKPLTFWMRQIAPGKPLNVAGGRVIAGGAEAVTIDVAIIGDRDGVLAQVLAHEVTDHMVLPMSLMLVFVLGATIFSVAQALRPVARAADRVAALDPLKADARLPTEGMPREIAGFTRAVNAAFDRVHDLMRSQKLLTSAISHEVRTPLAVAKLELAGIADPRARRVEQDLDALNRLVEQLTTLARLEGAPSSAMQEIDPAKLAADVVSALAGYVYASGKTIEVREKEPQHFHGHAALVENALRNLIENAARHTLTGTAIVVEAGPGACLSVRDNGDRLNGGEAKSGVAERQGLGLGLRIIRRIAEIHGARLCWRRVPGEGVQATLAFAPEA